MFCWKDYWAFGTHKELNGNKDDCVKECNLKERGSGKGKFRD
jgi:hypothetical protein